jgi:hypothetical protein
MNKNLRDALSIIEEEGLKVIEIKNGARHVRVHCEGEAGKGVVTVHAGTKVKSRFLPSIRSCARAIARGAA